MLRKLFSEWVRDTRGAVFLWFGLSFVVVAGSAALAIDMGHLYAMRTRLQGAADAAAMAAASELPDVAAARLAAVEYAGKNMPAATNGAVLVDTDVTPGNWDAESHTFLPGDSTTNAVRVVTRRAAANGNAVGLFFARIFGESEADLVATSIAGTGQAPLCILLLDPSAEAALDLGNGRITAHGCLVQVNSDHALAASGKNNGALNAEKICVTGGVDPKPSYDPTPKACDARDDPLSNLAAPAFNPACDYNGETASGGATLMPGVYCGGIDLAGSGLVTFTAGTYIIKDGPLSIRGSLDVEGDGVSFYLTGSGAIVDISGSGNIELKAPENGDLAGILFFQDRNATEGQVHSLRGTVAPAYEGTIYLPVGDVSLVGNTSAASRASFTVLIARRITLTGTASLDVYADYAASLVPLPPGLSGSKIDLVY